MSVEKKKVKERAFKPEFYVRAYDLSREGLSNKKISEGLGVMYLTFRGWLRRNPAFADAVARGRSSTSKTKGGKSAGETFSDFVFKRLPPRLRGLWNEIRAADREKNGEKRVELMLQKQGTRTKQHLFAHALVSSNFNAAEACRKIGLPYITWTKWKENDPEFLELIGCIQDMKKDFVEGCLMSLIATGDSAATIFASKTLNRDRGYDPKVTIEVNKQVVHGTLSLDRLLERLPIASQREILASLRQADGRKEPMSLEAHVDDADYETVEEDDE